MLHPILTPTLSCTRDVWEYGDAPEIARLRSLGPFVNLRALPDQFNLWRWSLIARQTGLYEYMYGVGCVAPRIYTKRLYNALKRGHEEARARVFTAETVPNMGLDAIKYYEAAQILWRATDPTLSLDQMRYDYCAALFGRNSLTAASMYLYFNDLEAFWARRPAREQRYFINFGSFQGYGVVGRAGWITQLDYLLRNEDWRIVENLDNAAMPLNQLWARLRVAYDTSSGLVRKRVQYFRRAFGLVRELARVYHPVARAFEILEADIPQRETDPLTWVLFRGRPELIEPYPGRPVPQIQPTTRDALVTRLNAIPLESRFTTQTGFQAVIRDPIHQYLASSDMHPSDPQLRELGLGFGAYSGGVFTSIDFNNDGRTGSGLPAAEGRHAFWLPAVKEYVEWWRNTGFLASRRIMGDARAAIQARTTWGDTSTILTDSGVDPGIGAGMFWTMKRIIATLMLASGVRVGDVILFLNDA